MTSRALAALALFASLSTARADPPDDPKDAPANAPPPPPAPVDEIEESRTRAEQLMIAGRYRLALDELQTAYAKHPSPSLLAPLGRACQRLGDGQRALAYWRRFLDGAPPGPERDAIEREVRRIAPVVEAPDAEPPRSTEKLVPVRIAKRSNATAIAIGATLLSIGYTAAAVGGTVLTFVCAIQCGARDFGGSLALAIPIVGPIVSAIIEKDAAWALGWVGTVGLLQ